MRTTARTLLVTLVLAAGLSPLAAAAVDDPSEMLPDPRQEARAEAIGAQLRCLVCQNESIEDSSAGLARDLRHVVRDHVARGESNRQIMDWMVGRYGNFIRLRPALTIGTLLLWGMPVLALLAGIGAAALAFRRSRGTAPAPLSDAERARLTDLTGPR
ncbi:cytochrome C biogenesis protein [Gluconacetobacter diazotrophicus PA1 5]|uniref:Cytochrome c-type biogenesis protein n=1 Tax=Gluconacetobacter diazotrophicus TaxID=33996 RepID=A0A7W4FEU1_GLUDI|nr:cytochrome c-type biogenesis protein [Gluconacetobacter diazotrophicus]ACI52661.1 cytochrome C biogenesis protein [Gluconacetobacter diazotrophicus PA1 5]MBB2156414.1 cytochrome c-type biogenesis protein CcmH [Gluconacetobacter diazotrophicus]TWB06068.1 cytochrome c-type biogenesis protein CcmH [Gluconacetobacter diazotrophicus]